MKVSTEIDNNFGYEKITQLVDNIPLIESLEIYLKIHIHVYIYRRQPWYLQATALIFTGDSLDIYRRQPWYLQATTLVFKQLYDEYDETGLEFLQLVACSGKYKWIKFRKMFS
jgi:hypothetical protein